MARITSPYYRPLALLLLITMSFQGCTHWVDRGRLPPEAKETVVRVLVNHQIAPDPVAGNGREPEWMSIWTPRVLGDSLVGTDGPDHNRNRRVAVPVAEIQRVRVERIDAGRTAVLVAGLGFTAMAIAAIVAVESFSDWGSSGSSGGSSSGGDAVYSCPLVYSWTGSEWRLDSGTFGGAIMRALQRTDVDNLDYAVERHGKIRLRLANELQETDYVDGLSLLAVDHDSGTSIAPGPDGSIHTLGHLVPPLRAADFQGRDALDRVLGKDGRAWESTPEIRDTTDPRDLHDGLELRFARPTGSTHAHLVMDGRNTPWAAYLLSQFVAAHGAATEAWYDSLNARPAEAQALGRHLAREAFLSASLLTPAGWTRQGLYWEAGPEVVKRQVLDLDLSRAVGDTVVVRLESVPSFWSIDHVAMDFSSDASVATRELAMVSAGIIREQDVAERIASVDGNYLALETGDVTELQFAAPVVSPGKLRSYLLRTTGWYHIRVSATGEPNTALLERANTPGGVSRIATDRMNRALTALGSGK